jgi:hypothetical protein
MATHVLSLSDLMLIEDWTKAAKENNKREIYRGFYLNGVDISKPIEYEVCTHKNLRGQTVTCGRILATERSDAAWLNSGAASKQAVMESIKDGYLVKELNAMSQQGISSAESSYVASDYFSEDLA